MRAKHSKKILDETKERRKRVEDRIKQGEGHEKAYGNKRNTHKKEQAHKKNKSSRVYSNGMRDMVSRKKVERMMEKRLEQERKQMLKEFQATGKIGSSFDDPSSSDDSDDSLLHDVGLSKNDRGNESDESSELEAWSGNDPNKGKGGDEVQVKQEEEEMSLFQPESVEIGNYPPIDDHEDMMPLFAPPHFDLDTGGGGISDLYDI